MDGGVRSGQDVLKAVALGARGTLIGRPFLYGLGAMGQAGVTKCLDLIRNELVSIFLRQVEYFKGVMILTTNRVEMLDLAFDSRVDIRLHYPTLDLAARRQIWQNFIVKLPGGSNIWGSDLDKLAALELNGRQIKSVMKTAHLLASGNGESVGFNHVKTVLRITRGEKV